MTASRTATLTIAATVVLSFGLWTVDSARAQTREGHSGSSGGGGTAVSSGGGGGSSSGGSSGGGSGGSSGGGTSVGTAVPRSSGGGSSGRAAGSSGSGGNSGTAVGRRERDGAPVVGTAVPRGAAPVGVGGGSGVIFVPGGYGFYPWGYGGLGLAGYYGGYYGDYYDPFVGPPSYFFPSQSGSDDDGSLRLKVKPTNALVYVDGYYVGRVDDFNGVLQRLHLSSGPHRIEIREDKYEPLTFDVNINSDHTVTYRGDLKKIG
jgi:hypothetical protein